MADAPARPAAPPPRKGLALQMLGLFLMFTVLTNQFHIRDITGYYAGLVLYPVMGFHGHYPVLTILLIGAILVAATTVVRHFTTDWLEMAKFQSYQRAFMKELNQAKKDNNMFKIKKLQEKQPEVMANMQAVQQKQMATMPLTLIISTPLYAWLYTFLLTLPDWHFTAPWNPSVDLFGNSGIIPRLGSLLPHWTLLLSALTIPLGIVIQRTMKFLSWKERWQGRHPEVHEG